MKILVCGGTGVVGSAIVRALRERNHLVRVLSRKQRTSEEPDLEFIQGSVFDSVLLAKAMQGMDVIINAVQFENAPFENPSKGLTYEKVDAEGTESIVRAARVSGVQRMVYISGAGTAEEKNDSWFRAKWRAEQAVRNSGMVWTIFRPSWIYGPEDRSLNRMIGMLRFFPIFPVLGRGYKIQPIFIDDVARSIAISLEKNESQNQMYEMGGPEALTMNQILECACEVMSKKRLFINIPKPMAGLLFSIAEKIPGIPLTRDSLDFLTMDILIPESERKKPENDFQIRFKTLREGLQTYLSSTLKI